MQLRLQLMIKSRHTRSKKDLKKYLKNKKIITN